jgi:hypothetical protein
MHCDDWVHQGGQAQEQVHGAGMTDLTDQLDAIQKRADAPFTTAANGIAQVDADRDFLLDLARKQQAAIDAVKALHVAVDVEVFDNPTTNGSHIEWLCGECDTNRYPCPTIEALEAKP